MASNVQEAKLTGFAAYLPAVADYSVESYQAVYDQNRQRVYSLAFWMTDNEIAAEELLGDTFRRAFSRSATPSPEAIDRAFLNEVREFVAIGTLTLDCGLVSEVLNIRNNTKRVHLERAVVQLPATERLIYLMHDGEAYSHAHISRMLGLREDESMYGLHQARLRIRELVSSMKF
jgi:RNA polymerase sigma-70 factor (ECF subfamily)